MPTKNQDKQDRPRRGRGFAGMDAEKQREIASKGGKAAHAQGTAHEFTPEEAREAGRKGGQASHARAREASAGATPSAAGGTRGPASRSRTTGNDDEGDVSVDERDVSDIEGADESE